VLCGSTARIRSRKISATSQRSSERARAAWERYTRICELPLLELSSGSRRKKLKTFGITESRMDDQRYLVNISLHFFIKNFFRQSLTIEAAMFGLVSE
jgi:hypothetical protein